MTKDIKKIIDCDKKGFIINGKHEYLIGGEFHYFRVPADMWEDRLSKMAATGANMVSVYIAWNMHEPVEGQQIWDGDYDLDRFLSLCKKYGLYVLIKPGPYICAELDFGGHPDWLIKKIANKEIRLRMYEDNYLALCKRWYRDVSEQINPHLITNGGCIVAAQLENEYDHLIEYGEEIITVDDAINYFIFLKNAMEEYGIDVPKFANEAEFLRGRGIIDTRTYYPCIPGLWMYEYERFEEKLISSKTGQSDSPIMILELQAGWFSQIGSPTYIPGLEVVEGVSKSVFITGASIVNYYMMVGGTTFPFIGARGDTSLGGFGNISSYDFGGAPVGETGEVNKDKFHWIKGFIRFARQFSHIIADSDGKHCMSITKGGENIAVLCENNTFLDTAVNKSYENFTTYEEGNDEGRFFFVRNVEEDDKTITVNIPKALMGREFNFTTTINSIQTRMFPVNFKVSDSLRINYSLSEIWQSKQYGSKTAVVLTGAENAKGELCLSCDASEITVLDGDVNVYDANGCTILRYEHDTLNIIKSGEVYLFIMPEKMVGRVDYLTDGLLFHNAYYIPKICDKGGISLDMQIKENTKTEISFFPMNGKEFSNAVLDGTAIPLAKQKSGMYSANFSTADYANRPQIEWTSDWKYCADSPEVAVDYNHSSWKKLDKPISLEEADFLGHGYYWYRAEFDVAHECEHALMNWKNNETDRYLLYINGELALRGRNRSVEQREIAHFLKQGKNIITILYANEFHNKSHPHEGSIVKYSGVYEPFYVNGVYKDGSAVNIKIEQFYVKQELTGRNAGFHTCDFDDSKWQAAPDTEKFVIDKALGHVVWFRRKFKFGPENGFSAPLYIIPKKADERLLIFINGKTVALYDIIGPQEKFYIPDSYLNKNGENTIAMILECPGFFEEIMSGYRRGYLYNPGIEPAYVAKDTTLQITKHKAQSTNK